MAYFMKDILTLVKSLEYNVLLILFLQYVGHLKRKAFFEWKSWDIDYILEQGDVNILSPSSVEELSEFVT